MKKQGTGYILLLFLCIVPGLLAIDWPVEEGAVKQSFGGNNFGRPFLGIQFESTLPIRSVEEGELLFTHNPNNSASRLPAALGAWIALDHGDGLISIYGQLERDRDIPLPSRVSKGTAIGTAASTEQGFYFSIFDRKERRWVNPSMIITPLEDSRPPTIVSVELQSPTGQSINPARTTLIRQGRYTLLVNAFDTRFSDREIPIAPYRIRCFVNGIEATSLSLETFFARDGTLMLYRNGLVSADQIYASSPLLDAGEIWLTRGQANLEIIVQDTSLNSRSVLYRLQVE